MKNFLYRFIKRTFDLLCCFIAFPFFLLILIGVTIAIKIEDGGPVFYIAERIGKDSKKIKMFKFRSMKVNAPNLTNPDGSTYNSKNDPRVTRVGKFLRDTSLDETAQILNVIKGDMSIIGPRASGWGALDSYQPDEVDKMKIRPGITGYTQAYYRNSISVREKRLMDAWYANNASLWLDIKIFFKTIQTVLKRENVYTNDAVASDANAKTKNAQSAENNSEETSNIRFDMEGIPK
ncbi:MAG: sugar transferase [Clostridia bacterium]|nr:sugar transferase [Clostridia bacterium]